MQRIEFVTDKGKVTFAKGSKYTFINFNPNDGDVEYQTATYVDQDGQDILNSTYSPRELSFDGNILAENEVELYKLRKNMVKIMNGKDKGILRYFDGQNQYFSECIASIPEFDTHIVNKALPFTADFNLYNFYWKSEKLSKYNIYSVESLITGTFTFPTDDSGLVFSTRVNKANVLNNGHTIAPCIIKITATKVNSDAYTSHGFIVKNNTTGKFIELNYDMSNGEVVTVNTDDMTITSSLNGNILYSISEDSEFFPLSIGKNEIECLKYDNTIDLNASIEFYNRFVGV